MKTNIFATFGFWALIILTIIIFGVIIYKHGIKIGSLTIGGTSLTSAT